MADTSPEGIAKILAALRGEHRTLINIHAAKTIEALTAERDALRAALERIRDDGAGWQRDTAQDALGKLTSPDKTAG